MKLSKLLLIVLVLCTSKFATAQSLNIIPEPYKITKSAGTYTLPKSIAIDAPSLANDIADEIANRLRTTSGRVVYFTKNKPSINLLLVNDTSLGLEGYTLDINQKNFIFFEEYG